MSSTAACSLGPLLVIFSERVAGVGDMSSSRVIPGADDSNGVGGDEEEEEMEQVVGEDDVEWDFFETRSFNLKL